MLADWDGVDFVGQRAAGEAWVAMPTTSEEDDDVPLTELYVSGRLACGLFMKHLEGLQTVWGHCSRSFFCSTAVCSGIYQDCISFHTPQLHNTAVCCHAITTNRPSTSHKIFKPGASWC